MFGPAPPGGLGVFLAGVQDPDHLHDHMRGRLILKRWEGTQPGLAVPQNRGSGAETLAGFFCDFYATAGADAGGAGGDKF